MSRIWRGLLGELEPWEHASRSLLTGKSSSPRGKQFLFPMLPAVLYLWRHVVPGYHGEGSDNTTETWFLLFGSPASWAGLAVWTHQPGCFLGSVCLGLKALFVACSSATQQSTCFFSLGIWAADVSKILPQMSCQHPHPYARALIQIGNNQAWAAAEAQVCHSADRAWGFPLNSAAQEWNSWVLVYLSFLLTPSGSENNRADSFSKPNK